MNLRIPDLSYTFWTSAIGVLITFSFLILAHNFFNSRDASSLEQQSSFMKGLIDLHQKTIDLRLRSRGWIQGDSRVAILAVDEDSVDLEGRWPWPRKKIADLLEKAFSHGVATIGIDMIFSEEDPLGDNDKLFANAIKKYAKNLVMGTYYDGADFPTPVESDLCLDALFQRTKESQYWQKEETPLKIVDSKLAALPFPRQALNKHLGEYFTVLEISRAQSYFDKNPQLIGKIKKALGDQGTQISEGAFPAMSVMVLNRELGLVREMLQDISPRYSNEKSLQQFFEGFLRGFTKKQISSLHKALREESLHYCSRFSTEQDELVFKKKYLEYWGDSAESTEYYKAFSLNNFWSKYKNSHKDLNKLSFVEGVNKIKNHLGPNLVPQIYDWEINIPLFAEVTAHSGYFNATQDFDGSIRRVRLIARHGNFYAPSLALKTYLANKKYFAKIAIGETEKGDVHSERSVNQLQIFSKSDHPIMTVPTDPQGRMLINYSGPQHMFPHISATQLLDDNDTMRITWRYRNEENGVWVEDYNYLVKKAEFLKGKILLVGATAIGIYDLRVTPFDGNFAGVETHANIISNLLTNEDQQSSQIKTQHGTLQEHPRESRYMGFALCALGLLLTGFLAISGPLTGLIATFVAMSAVIWTDRHWILPAGFLSAILLPLALILLLYIVLTAFKYFTEERQRKEIRGVFAKYVSPEVVKEILSQKGGIALGGKKATLTVLFSDIKGFTPLSEELDPEAMINLLGNYLTPMTDLVFANKGTLDKYIGDAIMAFWGAPLPFADHAESACRTALQMVEKLKDIQKENQDKGLPEIDIRIGINTGEMSVGNMGSETIRSYTILGDAVNTGARLEGINKDYGTRIIISEYTFVQVRQSFNCRELDIVLVEGKAWPLRIYELLSEGTPSPELAAMLQQYNLGLELYRTKNFTEAQFAFTKALEFLPDDSICLMYIDRCQTYRITPPPDNWDAVIRTHK